MWYCDSCNKPITEAADGLVLLYRENERLTGFRIVHQGTCDAEDTQGFEHLHDFLGQDGLIKLTSYLTVGPIMRNRGLDDEGEVQNVPALMELIRRLHVPQYEEARRYFWRPDVAERYADSNEAAPYLEHQLAELIARESGTRRD